ncbi:phosphonate utilization associated putative membrane protein [Legionella beliardensis]|uniref:Phosphonate utilization associated putative membrane protein n=1 Tax=Legionella beliardensis TaxID=91822 RepID=A0A378HYC4_9GAMM|nr:DMT family transporter [Legionella beliardensis]STX27889.1 phosphonate utilization associated putative membrane protein [Legionella beliardensis]
MDLKSISLFIVLLAAVGSAFWNINVKKSSDRVIFVTLMVIPQFLIALPLALLFPIKTLSSLYYIVASSLVQTGYIIFLSNAYNHGLINRVYPLAIGIPPLLSLLVWHFVLQKPVTIIADLGVILLSFGIISFTFARKDDHAISMRGILYAAVTSLFIFSYTLIDTFGVRNTYHPLAYISWLFFIKALILFIPMYFLYKPKLYRVAKENTSYIFAGLLAGVCYGIAIWAFTYSRTPPVLALRSTSMVFVFLFSIFYLKEQASPKIFLLTLLGAVGIFLVLIGE